MTITFDCFLDNKHIEDRFKWKIVASVTSVRNSCRGKLENNALLLLHNFSMYTYCVARCLWLSPFENFVSISTFKILFFCLFLSFPITNKPSFNNLLNIAELCRVLHLEFIIQHFEKTLVDSHRILLLFAE